MPRFKDTTSRRDSKNRILKKGFSERKDGEYYGSNVPLFRRNGYRQSGTMIP